MELGLRVSGGFRRANDLDCWRAWLRKAVHRACRWNANCVFGIAKRHTRVRGEFDLM